MPEPAAISSHRCPRDRRACRTHTRRRRPGWSGVAALAAALALLLLPSSSGAPAPRAATGDAPPKAAIAVAWNEDPAWFRGAAEWAEYDATRVIYGAPRRSVATMYTIAQHMDRATTVKAVDPDVPSAFPAFKQVLRETYGTPNYDYRLLRTAFAHRVTLVPYKVVISTQEDCGASFRHILLDGTRLVAEAFSYFPGAGAERLDRAADPATLFFDALPLVLRDPAWCERGAGDGVPIALVPPQVHPQPQPLAPRPATVRRVGREPVTCGLGVVEADHLVVEHAAVDGCTESHFWFAVDPALRRVLVRHTGPWGTEYVLRRIDWWAYWSDPRPA